MLRINIIKRVTCTVCGWSKTLAKKEDEPKKCPGCGSDYMPNSWSHKLKKGEQPPIVRYGCERSDV